MRLDIGATVYSRDGDKIGTVDKVVMHPDSREVTHFVVQRGFLLTRDVVIAVNDVLAIDADGVRTNLGPHDIDRLPDFIYTEYASPDPDDSWTAPISYPAGGIIWAGRSPTAPPVPVAERRSVPDDTVTIHDGMEVECSDGKIGTVDEVRIDAETGRVTHVVVSQGWLFPEQTVVALPEGTEVIDERLVLPCPKSALPTGDRARHG